MKKVCYNLLYTLGAVGIVLLVWVCTHKAVGNELILPSLLVTLKATGVLLGKGAFWTALSASVLRVFIAFGISFLLAFACAILAYALPVVGQIFAPIVSFLRSLPTLCVLLVILLWTGADVAPVAVAFLSLFPVLYAGLWAGLSAVDKGLLEMSKVYCVPMRKRITGLYFPSVLPYALREGTAGLSFALKLVVSAEVLAGTYKSLGFWMKEAKVYLETPTLFALLIVTFILGFVLECVGVWTARAVERGRV